MTITVAVFYASKVKCISDHRASTGGTLMIFVLLMLKTVAVSCPYT